MSKRTKVLAAVMSTVVMTTALMGCGGSSSSSSSSSSSTAASNSSASGSSSSASIEGSTITVWSHLSTDEVKELKTIAEKWASDNKCTVKVVEDKGEMQDAINAMKSSKGPDIYFGLAHDNLGTYQKSGVLEEVPEGTFDKSDYTQGCIDAVTIGGKNYAIPLATECVALFYNADKVKEEPKTIEDVVDSGKFLFDAQNFYQAFGMLSAKGGYVFKNNNGTLDVNDIGLGNDGAVEGFKMIQKMVEKDGMNADVNGDIAKAKFTGGETDYYISGPWDIADCEKSVSNLGIVALPTLGGEAMKPFMGVQCAFVNSNSKNKDAAWMLMKYLNENCGDLLIEKGNRIPASKKAQGSEKLKANKYADTFIKAAEVAIPMPNVLEMGSVWDPGANALKAVVAGTDAKEAASKCVSDIKEKIAASK